MIKLKIDNIELKVEEGVTIFEAAKSIGVEIPNMCYLKGYSNHPSCMVCMVKDRNNGKLHPSCAMPVQNGMDISTDDDEVFEARKDALELLLSDHVGECEARCRVACPAFMDIPKMNRLIATDKPIEALKVVKEEIALPLTLGYVCSAPCENACRRKSIDKPVAICQLKKYVALEDAAQEAEYLPEKEESNGKKVAIIGAGPTGMTAAFHLVKVGFTCTVYDRNVKAGGSLLDDNQPLELTDNVLDKEIEILELFGIEFSLGVEVDQNIFQQLKKDYDYIIIASGNTKNKNLHQFGFELKPGGKGFAVSDGAYASNDPKVFFAGSSVSPVKMAVRAVAHGKAVAFFLETLEKYGKGSYQKRLFNSMFNKLKQQELEEYLKESIPDNRLTPKNELDGYSFEDAKKEAERCLRCDCRKPKSCKLRIYSDEYGADQRKYKSDERRLVTKKFTNDKVIYEEEKCIRCSLCVDITQKEKELIGLSHVGRGFDVRINIPFNESLQKSLNHTAIKCALHCPTGAISLREGEDKDIE